MRENRAFSHVLRFTFCDQPDESPPALSPEADRARSISRANSETIIAIGVSVPFWSAIQIAA